MKIYNINVELTDDEDAAMKGIAAKAEKTVAQIIQEFWDGYTVGEKTQKGAVKAQVDQWIEDEAKTEIALVGAAATLKKIKVL